MLVWLVEDAVSDVVPLLGPRETGLEVGVVPGVVVVVSDDVEVVPTDVVLISEGILSEGVDAAEPDGTTVWDESIVDVSETEVCDAFSVDKAVAAEVTLVCNDEVISATEELVSEDGEVVTVETVTLEDGGGVVNPLSLEDGSEVKAVAELVVGGVGKVLEEVSVACEELEVVESKTGDEMVADVATSVAEVEGGSMIELSVDAREAVGVDIIDISGALECSVEET